MRRADTVSRPRVTGVVEKSSNDGTLARLGGDEFTILLDDIRDPIEAVRVAERVQSELAAAFVVNGQEVVISASIGIASSATPHTQAEDLIRDADIAMYRAKRSGKARCEVFDTAMHANAVKRLRLETELRKALDQGEFRVYYQPIVSLQTGRITGFEALSRWQRPEGVVPPMDFIPVAEETGLIIPMNRQLRLEACRQVMAWQSQFPATPPLTMSMNITAKEFAQPELASEIAKTIEQTGHYPELPAAGDCGNHRHGDAEKSGKVLSELKGLGVQLSIDDFGTGYSSLSRLRRIPVDTLKIDRVFVMNMDSDPDNREIVRVIITLAHNLGLKVVAEGAETEAHVKQLQQFNCEQAQGYFFSRPVNEKAMTLLLAASPGVRSASASS